MLTPASNDLDLLVRAAWLYYVDELTQAQVASRLFVSRQTVGRLLEAARQHGIVRVELDARYLAALQLATRLRRNFNLRDAIVVPSGDSRLSRGRINERVAAALAAYVRRYLHPGVVVGVGWGDSVSRALALLPDDSLHGVTFASAGGSTVAVSKVLADNPEVIRRLKTVPAPLVVSTPEVARAFRAEKAVSEVFDVARSATVTLTGVGSTGSDSSAVLAGVITEDDVERYAALGAVGDMLGEWYDAWGRVVTTPTSERRIGLSLDELRRMPNVVGVAAGTSKVDAIRGAVVGRYIKVLVTDEPTAEALLEKWGRSPLSEDDHA